MADMEIRVIIKDGKYCWVIRQGGRFFARSVIDFTEANQANDAARQAKKNLSNIGKIKLTPMPYKKEKQRGRNYRKAMPIIKLAKPLYAKNLGFEIV